MRRILLVEDDRRIAELVSAELGESGCLVRWTATGAAGLSAFEEGDTDLIVLDLNLPDTDGLQICERVRARDSVTPILMLTARATKQDVVRGLEQGADDYLTKPFDMLELVARVRAMMRRADAFLGRCAADDLPQAICCRELTIDTVQRQVHRAGRCIELTTKEFELLALFARNPGRCYSRDELLGRVWGDGFEGYEHTVNTHINRLRAKIEKDAKHPEYIETVWGVGYRFALPASP